MIASNLNRSFTVWLILGVERVGDGRGGRTNEDGARYKTGASVNATVVVFSQALGFRCPWLYEYVVASARVWVLASSSSSRDVSFWTRAIL